MQQERQGEEAKQIGPENPSNEVSIALSCLHTGRLQHFIPASEEITDDPEVLDWVEHCYIEFIDGVPPVQIPDYKIIKFNDTESAIIDSEIIKLLCKGVIVESTHSQEQFVSSIFLRMNEWSRL